MHREEKRVGGDSFPMEIAGGKGTRYDCEKQDWLIDAGAEEVKNYFRTYVICGKDNFMQQSHVAEIKRVDNERSTE